jgi:hypothetical protein
VTEREREREREKKKKKKGGRRRRDAYILSTVTIGETLFPLFFSSCFPSL